MDNKTSKSCFLLDEMQSYTSGTPHARAHAAMVGSMTACLLAYVHNSAPKPDVAGDEVLVHDYPPLHPPHVAGYLSTASGTVATALTLTDEQADIEWERVCDLVIFLGEDINWRSRPSIFDQLRG